MKKVVVITGASSGFGQATMKLLAQDGYIVVATARSPIEYSDPSVETLQLDVTDGESVRSVVSSVAAKYGRIDVLVNNAGFALAGAVEVTPIHQAQEQLDTNFFGMVRMIQAVLPHMRKAGRGLIINISALSGLTGLPFQAFYSASKYALEGLTEALRLEVVPFGVQVCNINPGDYATPLTRNRHRIGKFEQEPYGEQCIRTLNVYEHDERTGPDPNEVAIKIRMLIASERRPKVRYLLGMKIQVLGLVLKRVVPSKLFEHIMKVTYRIASNGDKR